MIVTLFLLLLIAVLGLAAATGHTADSRDPSFGMGRIAGHHPRR